MGFWHNAKNVNKKRRNIKAIFGGTESGSRLNDPEYLAKLAPPPLDSEEGQHGTHEES